MEPRRNAAAKRITLRSCLGLLRRTCLSRIDKKIEAPMKIKIERNWLVERTPSMTNPRIRSPRKDFDNASNDRIGHEVGQDDLTFEHALFEHIKKSEKKMKSAVDS